MRRSKSMCFKEHNKTQLMFYKQYIRHYLKGVTSIWTPVCVQCVHIVYNMLR